MASKEMKRTYGPGEGVDEGAQGPRVGGGCWREFTAVKIAEGRSEPLSSVDWKILLRLYSRYQRDKS